MGAISLYQQQLLLRKLEFRLRKKKGLTKGAGRLYERAVAKVSAVSWMYMSSLALAVRTSAGPRSRSNRQLLHLRVLRRAQLLSLGCKCCSACHSANWSAGSSFKGAAALTELTEGQLRQT